MRITTLLFFLGLALANADLTAPEIIAKTLAQDDARQQALRTMQYDQSAVVDQLNDRDQVTQHRILTTVMSPGANPPVKFISISGDQAPDLSDRVAVQAISDDVEGNKQTFTLRDLADRFTIALVGVEMMDGTAAYRFDFEPKAGQPYGDDTAKVVNQLHGSIWIARDTFHLLRIEAVLAQPVRVAWFFARVPTLRFQYRTQESAAGFADAEEKITLRVEAPFVGYHERQKIVMTRFRPR